MMRYEQDFIYKTIPQLTNAIADLTSELKRYNDSKEAELKRKAERFSKESRDKEERK